MLSFYGYSQDDTVFVDTTEVYHIKVKALESHSPKQAALLSAALPGLGQVYNKRYWKVPIIYIGFGALAYEASFLNKEYNFYRDLYNEAKESETQTVVYNGDTYKAANVKEGRDYYRKYRDLTLIGVGVWYVLNVIDANVDAHFFDYDVSDDLTLNINPVFFNPELHQKELGFVLRMKF